MNLGFGGIDNRLLTALTVATPEADRLMEDLKENCRLYYGPGGMKDMMGDEAFAGLEKSFILDCKEELHKAFEEIEMTQNGIMEGWFPNSETGRNNIREVVKDIFGEGGIKDILGKNWEKVKNGFTKTYDRLQDIAPKLLGGILGSL